jgi:hypothetical protein
VTTVELDNLAAETAATVSDVNKAWRVKAKASTHKAKVTVFWPEAKAKAKA